MMRKIFCTNDADDFEDLPAFNEDKVSLTMMIAGICAAVVAVAAITATIVCLLRRNKDCYLKRNTPDPEK